jgi:pimeloyl-ACP methyl ester carboxylesterase
LKVLMVANAADAGKISWTPFDYPNELNFMRQWMGYVYPSIQKLEFSKAALAGVTVPVLTIHGTRDRQSPYGGGREWASILPNARLLTIEGAAHVPWIESPDLVFGSIRTFLDEPGL